MSSKSPHCESKADYSPLYLEKMVIGTYMLDKCLGRGGSAEVWEAIHQKSRVRVALKLPSSRFLDEHDAAERFKREAELSLDHPCIRRVEYVVPQSSSLPFLKMDLLVGKSLRDEIKDNQPLSVRRSCNIARQIASALGALHRQAIVHRDVSASNVFLVENTLHEDAAKLIDFGLAISVASNDSARVPQSPAGTRGYIAPERLKRLGSITCKSDVFSLGIVLLECLRGQLRTKWFPLYDNGTFDTEKYFETLRNLDVLLDELPTEVPADLKSLLRKALEHDPEKRIDIRTMFDSLAPFADVHVPAIPEPEAISGGECEDADSADDATDLDESYETLAPISRSLASKEVISDAPSIPPDGEVDSGVANRQQRRRLRIAMGLSGLAAMAAATILIARENWEQWSTTDNFSPVPIRSPASSQPAPTQRPVRHGVIETNDEELQGGGGHIVQNEDLPKIQPASTPKQLEPKPTLGPRRSNPNALPISKGKPPKLMIITETTIIMTPNPADKTVAIPEPKKKSRQEEEAEATIRAMGLESKLVAWE